MASAATQRMTIEEFERRYLGKRAELWRGEVREYMPAGAKHGEVALNIGAAIQTFAKQHQLGTAFAAETGFIVRTPQGESVLAPDAAFIRRERLPQGEFQPDSAPSSPIWWSRWSHQAIRMPTCVKKWTSGSQQVSRWCGW